MTTEVLIKVFFVSMMSLMFSYIVFSRFDNEIGSENNDAGQRYLPYIPGNLLPACIIVLNIMAFVYYGIEFTAKMALSIYFTIFIHICFYYAILILLLPTLRKYINARAISMLWMIPNYLYITELGYMDVQNPMFIFKVSETLIWSLFGIMLIGFVIVMIWKFIEHMVFRYKVLYGSKRIDDPAILNIWKKEIETANIRKPKYKLVMSSKINTPLSIGLFKRTTKVVLPERNYTNDELSLIFRHEIIHIEREDVWSKFFLVFCTALCWYNPLMWIAMKKCSHDIELSCDETVLLNADEAIKKKYANLLLDQACSESGFTTCLASSSSAMHYRIKSIAKPSKKHSGALIVGLTFFILCMTSGFVAFAYGDDTGKEIIYDNQITDQHVLRSTTLYDDEFQTVYKVVDQEAFHNYLSNLTLSNITGSYSFDENDKRYTYILQTPKGTLGAVLSEDIIKIVRLYEEDPLSNYYYLPEKVDFNYLESIVVPCPSLNLHLKDDKNNYGKNASAKLVQYDRTNNDKITNIYKFEEPTDELSGIFGNDYRPYEAELSFSYDNVIDYSITIETWNRESSYTIHSNELKEKFTIPLPNYPAHYTFNVTFQEDGYTSNAVFTFNIGKIE